MSVDPYQMPLSKSKGFTIANQEYYVICFKLPAGSFKTSI